MRWLPLVVLATLAALAVPGQAAPTMHTHLDWTEGTFEAGLQGLGKALFPEAVEAPDHERIPFPVNPCHRQLSLGLTYEPRNASARVSHGGNAAEVIVPYRFQAGLIAPNGTVLHRIEIEEPDLSIDFGLVEEPGEHTLELELLEGALVDWRVRVRGFAVHGDPTCDVWLNEAETNASQGGDWVELYNGGDEPVDVGGWQVHANVTNATTVLGDTVLAPDEHRSLALTGDAAATGETLTLRGPEGSPVEATPVLDDEAGDDRTWQQEADAPGPWLLAEGTPGGPNAG